MRSLWLVVLVALAACESYEEAQADARAEREDFAACKEGDECDIVEGVSDCFGVFDCPFPVNLSRREEARRRASEIAKESRSYSRCTSALCNERKKPARCDVAKRKCVDAEEF